MTIKQKLERQLARVLIKCSLFHPKGGAAAKKVEVDSNQINAFKPSQKEIELLVKDAGVLLNNIKSEQETCYELHEQLKQAMTICENLLEGDGNSLNLTEQDEQQIKSWDHQSLTEFQSSHLSTVQKWLISEASQQKQPSNIAPSAP